MPFDAERHARLYYDESCGPCGLLASSVAGLSRGRVAPVPLAAPSADAELADLSSEQRFDAAHLIDAGGRTTGAEIVPALVGLTFGPAAERAVDRIPPFGRSLKWLYRRFWSYRRRHGCAAGPGA